MYVKLNGSKVTYDGPSDNLRQTVWQPWDIDLALFVADLKNVTTLSIGLERDGTVGGQGVVYFDDIRLYPYSEPDTPPDTPVAGYALEFDGADDYVETPLSDVPANGTVEAWVKSTSEARQAVFSSHGGEEFRLHLNYRPGTGGNSPGVLGLNVRYGTLRAYADIGSNIYDGSWHHVAFAWEGGSPGTIMAYWDGQEKPVTYGSQGDWAGNYNRDVVHVIGRECLTNDNYYFSGLMDEVRFWDKARSAFEIQEYMSRVLLGDEEGLVGCWEFNEGEGTTAYDSSPNENNATVVGATWMTDAAPVTP
jgi:hypothetical protein